MLNNITDSISNNWESTNTLSSPEIKKYLTDLNPAQLEAVLHKDGPLLIFAGAGSGKTRVLTRRIAHLVLEHGVNPAQIFAVTFTNKAANEMKNRVSSLFGGRSLNSWVATFHSNCCRILRTHADLLGYTKNFAIYDSSDSLATLKRAYKKVNLDPKIIEPKYVSSKIERAKNNYRFPEDIRGEKTYQPSWADMTADLYETYQAELREANAMDFGDLICNTVTLFKLEPLILEQYQDRFKYLLVDEYQDTNKIQYMLIKMLSEKHQNVCAVGDDDQSIYAFRGATIDNILNFNKDFPEAKVVTLDINYRSTKTILQAANAIIAKNKKRQEKSMKTPNASGKKIVAFCGYDEPEEADFVVQETMVLLSNGSKASDVAVFYRTNAQSRALEEALSTNGIPYQIFGGHRFYDRKEIKDILAYYRLLINPNDNEAFLRIINTPTRGIGASSVGALISYAEQLECPLLRALENAVTNDAPFLKGAKKKKFKAFLDLIEELKEDALKAARNLEENSNSLAELLKSIAEKSTYLPSLVAQDSPEAESRVENIYELFNVAVEFVNRSIKNNEVPSLVSFLERASLSSDLDTENSKRQHEAKEKFGGSVSLMTLHLAKGLEFENVFFVGLEEGLIPHSRSLDDRSALEEERRLCYVGITRAKKQLFLSRVLSRNTFGQNNWNSGMASRFLDDLPEELVETRRGEFFE